MTKRRKPPRGVAEPLFSGYSLEAARQPALATRTIPDATPIPRATAAPVRRAAVSAAVTRRLRLPGPQGPAVALRVREVLCFPARLLPSLPAGLTLLCEACLDGHGASVPVVITTNARDYEAAQARQYVTLHGAELAAVVLAAELDRASPAEFEHWCAQKQQSRVWELTPRVTLGHHISRHDQQALTVGEVLQACGARLLNVADAAPAPTVFWDEPLWRTCG